MCDFPTVRNAVFKIARTTTMWVGVPRKMNAIWTKLRMLKMVWECCSGDAVYELSIMMHLELDCVPPPFT